MTVDLNALADHVRGLGRQLGPAALEGSAAAYAPLHDPKAADAATITRDIAYGSDPRHKLDLFEPKTGGGAKRPILVFVHGGGFVRGDKRSPGTPFHDHIPLWAVAHGMIGVTITYRLAPQHPWPAGPEDLAAVVRWLKANAASHGGDPDAIFLMGTSAGAVHVASYVAHRQFHVGPGAGIAGAILLSGIYDLAHADRNDAQVAYFGEDQSKWAAASSLPGLVETEVPLLIVVAEYDPPTFEIQALELVAKLTAKNGELPRFVRLMGNNHFTAGLNLGTADDYLARQIQRFVKDAAAGTDQNALRRAG
jgi:triacylglycerol lipase